MDKPLWIFIEQEMMEAIVVPGGTEIRAKLQPNHHHRNSNTQFLAGQVPFLSPNQ